MKPRVWLFAMTLLLFAVAVGVIFLQFNTADISDIVEFKTAAQGEEQTVSCWTEDGETYYVFLPSFAELPSLRISLHTEKTVHIDGTEYRSGDTCRGLTTGKVYSVEARGKTADIIFMKSENVPSMFVDVVSGSIENVNEKKGDTAQINVAVYTSDGSIDFEGVNDTLKGRGNTTWTFDKKPYSITLTEAQSILGMDAGTKWVLRANAQDETNLRNKIVHDLAGKTCRQWTPDCEYVDLYIDGDYCGLYLLMEKIELIETRFDAGSTNGFYLGDITGAWQWDDPARFGYTTNNEIPFEFVYPENCSSEQKKHISDALNNMESALLDDNSLTYIDTDSWARRYLVDEISANTDADYASTYLCWHDEGDGKPVIYAGPIWDYDGTFGSVVQNNDPESFVANTTVRYGNKAALYNNALCKNEQFMTAVREIYKTEFLPLLTELINGGVDEYAAGIEKASAMNCVRWQQMFNEITADQCASVRTAAELKNYISERTNFLTDALLDNGQYHNIELCAGEKGYLLNYTVKHGECFDAFTEFEKYGITEPVWTNSESGEPYDTDMHVTEDLIISVKDADSGVPAVPDGNAAKWNPGNHKTELICFASATGIVCIGIILLLIDKKRNKESGR